MLPVLGDDVSGKRLTGRPIVERDRRPQGGIDAQQSGEISGPHLRVRHGSVLRESLPKPHRFPGREVERFVL